MFTQNLVNRSLSYCRDYGGYYVIIIINIIIIIIVYGTPHVDKWVANENNAEMAMIVEQIELPAPYRQMPLRFADLSVTIDDSLTVLLADCLIEAWAERYIAHVQDGTETKNAEFESLNFQEYRTVYAEITHVVKLMRLVGCRSLSLCDRQFRLLRAEVGPRRKISGVRPTGLAQFCVGKYNICNIPMPWNGVNDRSAAWKL